MQTENHEKKDVTISHSTSKVNEEFSGNRLRQRRKGCGVTLNRVTLEYLERLQVGASARKKSWLRNGQNGSRKGSELIIGETAALFAAQSISLTRVLSHSPLFVEANVGRFGLDADLARPVADLPNSIGSTAEIFDLDRQIAVNFPVCGFETNLA